MHFYSWDKSAILYSQLSNRALTLRIIQLVADLSPQSVLLLTFCEFE